MRRRPWATSPNIAVTIRGRTGYIRFSPIIESNKSFCLNTLHSLARSQLDSYLYNVTYDLMMGVVEEVSRGMHVAEENKKFLANFYTLAFTGLVTQWMQQGMKEEPALIVEQLSELMQGNFERALQRYRQKI